MKKKLLVGKSEEKMRLDLFLAIYLDGFTRSFLKKQIEENRVKVNGEVEFKANYRVKEGDKIEIQIEEEQTPDDILPEEIEIDVLYEDEDLVAVNKPVGMVVHPATGNFSGTLVNALLHKYKDLKHIGKRIRSGLINRIDKDTSGIVLVGKTNKALWFYTRQFANREVFKQYLAVVKGDFSKTLKGEEEIQVTNYIGRNPKNRLKFAVVTPRKGRLAKTKFEMLGSSKNKKYSFLSAQIETGRTHQIRVHLNYLGFSVVGDKLYSGLEYDRLLLHAYSVGLRSLEGENLIVKAGLEGKFRKFLQENFDEDIYKKFVGS